MVYKALADSVVLIHFLWVLFLIFGALWGSRNRGVKIVHVLGLVFASVVEVCDWYCPLTHLEVWLRSRHNPAAAYTGSFVIHYLEKVLYMQLPRPLIVMLTIALCLFNFQLYRGKKQNRHY